MNTIIKDRVNRTKENMHKRIRARVIKVNININMERKLLPQISSIYTLQFTTDLFNIHTSVHQLGLGCFNLNLNTTQCYYVNMPHSLPMIEDGVEDKLVVNLNNLSQ
jgi:hypothetical protein